MHDVSGLGSLMQVSLVSVMFIASTTMQAICWASAHQVCSSAAVTRCVTCKRGLTA